MKWIKVSDQLPDEFVLVVMKDDARYKIEIGYYVKSMNSFFKQKEVKGNFFKTTHWAPLPND